MIRKVRKKLVVTANGGTAVTKKTHAMNSKITRKHKHSDKSQLFWNKDSKSTQQKNSLAIV